MGEGSVLLRKQDGWLIDDDGTVWAPKAMLDEYATRLSVLEIVQAQTQTALASDRARIAQAIRKVVFPEVARPAMEEVLRVVKGE